MRNFAMLLVVATVGCASNAEAPTLGAAAGVEVVARAECMSDDFFIHVTYSVELFSDGAARSRCGLTTGDESAFAPGWSCKAGGMTIDKADGDLWVDAPTGRISPKWDCEAHRYDSRGVASPTTIADLVKGR